MEWKLPGSEWAFSPKADFMVAPAQKTDLSLGCYGIAEAAAYAEISNSAMTRWLFGAPSPTGDRQMGGFALEDAYFVNFPGWIQALAFRAAQEQLRRYGLNINRLRSNVVETAEEKNLKYPLAREDSELYIHEGGIYIYLKNTDEDPSRVTGGRRGQMAMKKVIAPYRDFVDFDSKGDAHSFTADRAYPEFPIVMSPRLHMGEPVVGSTGYTARALYDAALDEGDENAAAEAYDVDRDAILAAVNYILRIS